MISKFLTNNDNELLEAIRENITTADRIYFATAFGSVEGFNLVKDSFDALMSNAGSARFLFDISQGMTSPDLIEELATYPGEAKVKISVQDPEKGFLHSKIYSFEGDENTLIVGSNNFSRGGLMKNTEAALLMKNPHDTTFYDAKDFINSLWNSQNALDPTVHPEIFEQYKSIHKSWRSGEFVKVNSDEILSLADRIRDVNDVQYYENNNLDILYLIGALAANIRYQDINKAKQGLFELKYRSQAHNSYSPGEKGYITNIVDGERLGNIRLPQFKTMRKYIEGVKQHLEAFIKSHDPNAIVSLEDNSKTNLNVSLKIQFRTDNNIKDILVKYMNFCGFENSVANIEPRIPRQLPKLAKNIGIQFIQGYMDFRSRLSQADKVGEKMRIGVQVDKGATRFLYECEKYLEGVHGFEVNVNDGSSRGKDNMLRITADENTTTLFNSTWQKRMSIEFAQYNQR